MRRTPRHLAFDDSGLNVEDPNDSLGIKSAYISLIQQKAFAEIVGKGSGVSLDVGCGTGRMCAFLDSLGYESIGVDPSKRLLEHASHTWGGPLVCASLPDLPFNEESVDQVFLINLLRVLHLSDLVDVALPVAKLIRPGGRLIILDNIKKNDRRFVGHDWIVDNYSKEGLILDSCTPIRFGRRITTYLLRYGLIPSCWVEAVAERELRVAKSVDIQKERFSYMNVVYVFRKRDSVD